jgi:ankyrin repeat protein
MDDVVNILLENGADVNFQRNDGATALFIACEMNYRTIVRLLLSYGADVNHRRDNKSTPLFMVCCKGYASIVTMLLIRNADLNICQKDASPLFSRMFTTSSMPLWQASNNGLESTQYLITSALNRSNNFIISACPFWQAIKRGVKESAVESLTLALLSKRS